MSVLMRRIVEPDDIDVAGDFAWAVVAENGPGYRAIKEGETPTHICVVCPDGEIHLPIQGQRGWTWDGNLDEPTIKPSIWNNKDHGGWHGFITSGELRDA